MQRDVTLPAEALPALRATLGAEVGPVVALQALQAAGYRAGEIVHERLAAVLGGDTASVADARFWPALSEFFSERGWGSLDHSRPHPAVGLLSSPDCAEADVAEERRPSCSFTAGILGGVLSRAAGGPIAVLQVACRAAGDDACTFAFGSEATIQTLYEALRVGTDLDSVLRSL
jgi:predicted hydrocarbon binding protein